MSFSADQDTTQLLDAASRSEAGRRALGVWQPMLKAMRHAEREMRDVCREQATAIAKDATELERRAKRHLRRVVGATEGTC